MKILCVEDGSVDIDALENGELRDGKVLVYRQGSKPPFILEIPNEPNAITELKQLQKMFENDSYYNGYVLLVQLLNFIMNMLLKEFQN